MKVLIVEDDAATLQMMATMMRSWGYHVRAAASGHAALRHIIDDCPDVVVSDLVMPGMSGNDLLQAIRAIPGCHVHFVLITGFPTVPELVRAITDGADECLLKPLDIDKLHAILTAHEARVTA